MLLLLEERVAENGRRLDALVGAFAEAWVQVLEPEVAAALSPDTVGFITDQVIALVLGGVGFLGTVGSAVSVVGGLVYNAAGELSDRAEMEEHRINLRQLFQETATATGQAGIDRHRAEDQIVQTLRYTSVLENLPLAALHLFRLPELLPHWSTDRIARQLRTRILVGSINPERSSPARWEGSRLEHPAHIAASLPRDVLRRLSAGADPGEVERRLLSESLRRRGLEPEPPVTGAHHGEVFSSELVGCRVVDETAFREFARVRTWSPEVHPDGPPEVRGPFDETVRVYVSFSLAVISSERGRFLRVPTQLRPSYLVRAREGVTESLRPFGTF
jgi:hypothetical protein